MLKLIRKNLFECRETDIAILYLYGNANKDGKLILKGEAESEPEIISFGDIVNEWKYKSGNLKFLHIVVDCPSAGKWA